MKQREAGFSLIEIVVAVGIIAILTASGIAFAASQKPYELAAATTQFDAMLDAARTLASSFEGATIYVTSDNGPGANFHAAVYSSWPGARQPQRPSTIPAIDSKSAIAETTTLQAPAFAIIIHGNGVIGTRRNFRFGETPSGSELACPPSASFTFSFTVNGQLAQRLLPCRIRLATTGNITLETPPPASTAPPAVLVNCSGAAINCTPIQGIPPTAQVCPAGETLFKDACRSPLVVQPSELFFHYPGDNSPEKYDANGNDLDMLDPTALVNINESYFRGSYSIEGNQCNGIVTPNASNVSDQGSGSVFNLQSVGTSSSGRCTIEVSDDGASSASLQIIQAGPLQILDGASQAPVTTAHVTYSIGNQAYVAVQLDTAKQLFSPIGMTISLKYGRCQNGSAASSYFSATSGIQQFSLGNTAEISLTITGLQETFSNFQSFSCRLTVNDQFSEAASLDVTVDPRPITIQALQTECTTLFDNYRATVGGTFPTGVGGLFGRQSNGVGNPYGASYILGPGGALSSEVVADGYGVFSAHRDDYFAVESQHLVYARQSVNGPQQTAAFLYSESADLLLVAPWSPTNNAPNSAGVNCIVKDSVPGWS